VLARAALASMGPPTNVDGEEHAADGVQHHDRRLQWGRRQTSTERRIARRSSRVSASLQWGRRQTSMERFKMPVLVHGVY